MPSHPLWVAVFADIHANFDALDACIKDSRTCGAQEYIVLGDIASDWHMPNECVEAVRDLTPLVIRGESEQYLKDAALYMDLWEIYDQFAATLWSYQNLKQENLQYLAALPSVLSIAGDSVQLRAVHGSPFRLNQRMAKEDGDGLLVKSLNAISEDVLLFAHTHEQRQFKFQGKLAVNPGSVGLHFNKKKAAEYALLEIRDSQVQVHFRQVSYALDSAFTALMRTELYRDAYVSTLVHYLGMVTGRNTAQQFRQQNEVERSHDVFARGGPIPNDIYNKVFDDSYAQEITELLLHGE